jgi:adenosylcobinamide kinase/adenosylcobinamide-phosphate guanylyltransferase
MPSSTLTLITGGARSGKSARALKIATENSALSRRFFIATAEPLDEEMRARITHHRSTRPSEFVTIEEPIELADAFASLRGRADVVVVDCLTLWLSNVMGRGFSDEEIMERGDKLASTFSGAGFNVVVVTDEVGWGIVPEHAVARRFRDLLGWTNQKIANVADSVILMAAGQALQLK